MENLKSTARLTAIVPMKGRSERTPDKNRAVLGGRPLYHWILDTLLRTESVSGIVVVIDGDEFIRDVRREWPGEPLEVLRQPFPSEGRNMNEIIAFVLGAIGGEHFLQTHATNPFLRTETIDAAVGSYFQGLGAVGGHDSLFSATPLQRRLWSAGRPLNHDPYHLVPTQRLEPTYVENSALYVFSRSSFTATGSRIGKQPGMFLMEDPMESFDIDTPHDLLMAGVMAEMRGHGQ